MTELVPDEGQGISGRAATALLGEHSKAFCDMFGLEFLPEKVNDCVLFDYLQAHSIVPSVNGNQEG